MTPVLNLLPMVHRIVSHYRARVWNQADREDMFQEAAIGLLEAASRYETGRGVGLGCYGSARAKGACLDQVRLLARRGCEVQDSDVLLGSSARAKSSNESKSPESRVMLARFRRFLADGRLSLPEPERSVLRQRYQEGLSVREVARDQGVSPATVLRIEKRALNVLRAGFLAAESR